MVLLTHAFIRPATNYIDLQSKTRIEKLVFYGYFVGAEREYGIKNCCSAFVSKIQVAAFMYSAFRFQIMV